MKYTILTTLTISLLAIIACNKQDYFDTEIPPRDAEFAFPLFKTFVDVNDLINQILDDSLSNDAIVYNADQSISLIYSGDVVESKATEIFPFFQGSFGIPVADSSVVMPFNAPDGITIRQVLFLNGELSAGFINTYNEPISVTFTIPQLTKDGQAFEIQQTIPVSPFFPIFTPILPLKGWVLKSSNTQGNTINFEYKARKTSNGSPVVFLPNSIGIPGCTVAFNNLQFSYMEGYWGQVEYPLSTDVIDININQTNLTGDVKIKNPKVTVTLFNSFGFPTRGLVKKLSFRSQTGEEIPLESPLINTGGTNGIDFAYPSLAAGEVGQTKATTFAFDNTNSNIEEIFNLQPTQMIYNVVGLANAEQDPNLIGFLTDSSKVRLNVKVELTLEGTLNNFNADQTLPLDFSNLGSGLDTISFESAEFKLVTENSIPMTVNMQVYFQNEQGQVIDSLFSDGRRDVMLPGLKVLDDPEIWSPTSQITFIPMSAIRFDNIRQHAKKAFLSTALTTPDGGTTPVKIIASQGAEVRMGVRVKARL